jgi:GNAT superfamily N-acetyltransferase
MITVSEIDPRDEALFDQWFAILHATDQERSPDKPGWHRAERLAWALDEDGPEAHRLLLATDGDGRAVGIADLETYRRENPHLARMELRVLPAERRRGVGTALLEAAVARARAGGRTELGGMDESPVRPDFVDTAGPFARQLGFAPAQHMARRELALPRPPGVLEALTDSDAARPSGYSFHTFYDRWPDEWIEDRCVLGRRMSIDVPHGDQALDEETWDEARVRQIEAVLAAQNRGKVSTVARDDASGRLVGYTEIAVPRGASESVWQHDTLVMREHRGHGLGFAMKVATLAPLLSAYPGVRRISTWNALENVHMIAVNEAIGFTLTATSVYWLRQL